MQRSSCESVQLLLSKYADNEATPAERERVESHVAGCPACARKLAGYDEIAAIFSSASPRQPEPELRAELFQEIKRQKEEELLKERQVRQNQPRIFPQPVPQARKRSFASGVWAAVSPFAVATVAFMAFVGLVFLLKEPAVQQKPDNNVSDVVDVLPVPTQAPPISSRRQDDGSAGSVPGAVSTASGAIQASFSPTALESATVLPTAGAEGGYVNLDKATPVLEDGDPTQLASWHFLRDPVFGYTIAYPPNWWTSVNGSSRLFFPWGSGGTNFAPYWVELDVSGNPQGLTPQTANARMLGGAGSIVPATRSGAFWLRHNASDAQNMYDDLYSFDSAHMYKLRLSVPKQLEPGDFNDRWRSAQAFFSRMTSKVAFAQPASKPTSNSSSQSGFAPVLFLDGVDLETVDPVNGQTRAITHGGYVVRQFALSSDLRTIAFTSARSAADTWASDIYLASLGTTSSDSPKRLSLGSQSLQIHDIIWYSDRELVAIAEDSKDGLGMYRIRISGSDGNPVVDRIATLGADLVGAKGLSVAPDRQLITFLAPFGEGAGTDIYSIRPDGSDLQVLVSHADPVSPSLDGNRVLSPQSQAVKSYVWTAGHLEYGVYNFNMLFTCGNSASPTFYRGGFLYSAPGAAHSVLLDQTRLAVADPTQMQIVHIAYSPEGRLAMTGYYSDRPGRADQLAGLWVADVTGNALTHIQALPTPDATHGITDLQWSPDGSKLIYRETMPQDTDSLSARYDGHSPFQMVEVDPTSGRQVVLYDATRR